MKVLNLLRLTLTQGYYRWAMREIPHTIGLAHEDVPKIVIRQRQLEDEMRATWA